MKIAIIGSRSLKIADLRKYIPAECSEIVSGGAVGIDMCAAAFARDNNIPLTEFFPQYSIYGKYAPIVRNKEMVTYADMVIAFWNGHSRGTLSVINYCKKLNKACIVINMPHTSEDL